MGGALAEAARGPNRLAGAARPPTSVQAKPPTYAYRRSAASLPFSGRIGPTPLRPGSYNAILTANTLAGRSAAMTVSFVVVP